ncbi:MAG: hypothetical protein V1738_04845 [Patescibacteria group bacterium]
MHGPEKTMAGFQACPNDEADGQPSKNVEIFRSSLLKERWYNDPDLDLPNAERLMDKYDLTEEEKQQWRESEQAERMRQRNDNKNDSDYERYGGAVMSEEEMRQREAEAASLLNEDNRIEAGLRKEIEKTATKPTENDQRELPGQKNPVIMLSPEELKQLRQEMSTKNPPKKEGWFNKLFGR